MIESIGLNHQSEGNGSIGVEIESEPKRKRNIVGVGNITAKGSLELKRIVILIRNNGTEVELEPMRLVARQSE